MGSLTRGHCLTKDLSYARRQVGSRPNHRRRQSEGRRRQDHDSHQPGDVPRALWAKGPAGRHRSSGESDERRRVEVAALGGRDGLRGAPDRDVAALVLCPAHSRLEPVPSAGGSQSDWCRDRDGGVARARASAEARAGSTAIRVRSHLHRLPTVTRAAHTECTRRR